MSKKETSFPVAVLLLVCSLEVYLSDFLVSSVQAVERNGSTIELCREGDGTYWKVMV